MSILKCVPYGVKMKNVTDVTIVVLKGLIDDLEQQIILFFMFLAIYLFTLMENLGLVV